ncbi:GNAT family N-acetyltransferase [Virgibacillus byunsanensis]|uniref:GNAT family N-acetyltransferase n=1 Tax=Virgibacillus byunsanensis TaxID=570945 RepID=A0ABW3LQ37_9BACI
MKIRKAALTDAPHIAKVHVDSWRTTYKDIFPQEYLNNLSYEERTSFLEKSIPQQDVYVAENNQGEIVGFSVGGLEREGKHEGYLGELYAIYIVEEYQGNGIGKELVKPVVEQLKQVGINTMLIWVLEDNDARYFYESIGGRKIDTVEVEMAGVKVNETAYGWDDLKKQFSLEEESRDI